MGDPLRVLHAVVNMNRGGAETFIMNLYRNIDRSKIQFDFLTSKPGVFDDEIKALGGIIHRIPYISEVGHFGYKRALNDFFAKHSSYKIVHAHMDRMSGIVLQAAKKNSIPNRIAHSHNTQSEGGVAARLYKWFAGTSISTSANQYVACTYDAATWLFQKKSKETYIMKNGIESDLFKYSEEIRKLKRTELGISDNTLVLGHVGRFAKQKNHSMLIDIFAKVQQRCPNSLLLLAGEGPLRSSIEKKVSNLQLADKVAFLGVQTNVNHLMQAFDLFVFPSHHEGLGIVLIEAQASGLPCVISEKIPKEVDLGIGLVTQLPLNNEESFVDEVLKISSQSFRDRSVSSRSLSEQGYNIRKTAQSIEGYYYSILR